MSDRREKQKEKRLDSIRFAYQGLPFISRHNLITYLRSAKKKKEPFLELQVMQKFPRKSILSQNPPFKRLKKLPTF